MKTAIKTLLAFTIATYVKSEDVFDLDDEEVDLDNLKTKVVEEPLKKEKEPGMADPKKPVYDAIKVEKERLAKAEKAKKEIEEREAEAAEKARLAKMTPEEQREEAINDGKALVYPFELGEDCEPKDPEHNYEKLSNQGYLVAFYFGSHSSFVAQTFEYSSKIPALKKNIMYFLAMNPECSEKYTGKKAPQIVLHTKFDQESPIFYRKRLSHIGETDASMAEQRNTFNDWMLKYVDEASEGIAELEEIAAEEAELKRIEDEKKAAAKAKAKAEKRAKRTKAQKKKDEEEEERQRIYDQEIADLDAELSDL